MLQFSNSIHPTLLGITLCRRTRTILIAEQTETKPNGPSSHLKFIRFSCGGDLTISLLDYYKICYSRVARTSSCGSKSILVPLKLFIIATSSDAVAQLGFSSSETAVRNTFLFFLRICIVGKYVISYFHFEHIYVLIFYARCPTHFGTQERWVFPFILYECRVCKAITFIML